MGFFHADAKASVASKPKPKQRLQDIPVTSLRKMGCEACPRNTDESLESPKMWAQPEGENEIFLLTAAPSEKDDRGDQYLRDSVGAEIARLFGRNFMSRSVSVSGIVQCAGKDEPSVVETECCRSRVIDDIERAKPVVVITLGDAPLAWATGLTSAIPHRGTLMRAKIGDHVCYVYPLLYPNYLQKKKSSRKSEYELAMEYDIDSIKKQLPFLAVNPAVVATGPYDAGIEIITGQKAGDMQRLEAALQRLMEHPKGALDIETNCLRPFMHRRPMILTAAVGSFEDTVAFSLDHPEGWGSEHQRQRAKQLFYDYLQHCGRTACHNLGFEMEWLVADGAGYLLRRKNWDDTQASAYTLDERRGTKALGMQTLIYLGFDLKKQSRVDASRILDFPLPEVLRYNGMDTKWTNVIRDIHQPYIDGTPGFRELYEDKVDLAATLALTTAAGLPVDFAFAKKTVTNLQGELATIEVRLRKDGDVLTFARKHGTFSPTNPDHMLLMLKDLKRPEIKLTDKRTNAISYSTSEEILIAVGNAVPACGLVLEHRSVSKLLGTYVLPTADGSNVCPDGMIRSNYNSMDTVTDRLSANDPAVQNWPKRKHKYVRAMVDAPDTADGEKQWFVALDYGQIEFRVVGMASEDPNLVKYCWTGYDVHKAWAQRLMVVYPQSIDWVRDEFKETLGGMRKKDAGGFDEDKAILKLLRQEMKNKWVFPQLFGSTTKSCADNLHLPDDVADDLGKEFWDEFRVVKKWQDRIMSNYEKNLYVETLTGTRRRGPTSRNEAINMPIQGTAAAIVKRAMTALSVEAERTDNPELQPRLNVHDDLSTIMRDSTMAVNIDRMAAIMCKHRYDFINVPLVVEASVGPNWADLEEIKVYRSDVLFNLKSPYGN